MLRDCLLWLLLWDMVHFWLPHWVLLYMAASWDLPSRRWATTKSSEWEHFTLPTDIANNL